MLRNRPDVRGVENKLIAANADIGVVTSTFFPSISLTSVGVTGASSLNKLFADSPNYYHYLFKNTMRSGIDMINLDDPHLFLQIKEEMGNNQ